MAVTNQYIPHKPEVGIPDVFITPRFLQLEFGFKKSIALEIGKLTAEIARKRWPKATLYLHIDGKERVLEDEFIFAFLSVDYDSSKALGEDMDKDRWDVGAYMKEATQWTILKKAIALLKSEKPSEKALLKAEAYYRPKKKKQ